jgi:DNA-binding NtrC family response regulator
MKPLKDVRLILGAESGADLTDVMAPLEQAGAIIERLGTIEQLRKSVKQGRGDVVLMHVCGQRGQAFAEMMKHPEELKEWPPVILLTCTEETYLPAMRAGVFDCLVMPIDEGELERIVTLALESREIDLPVSAQP